VTVTWTDDEPDWDNSVLAYYHGCLGFKTLVVPW
jgi:hypothetical protein